jgi:hypothetical protein
MKTVEHKDNFKILCIYCNAPWDAKMEAQLEGTTGGCDSCGYGATARFSITITCSNCDKPVYKKEFEKE